MPSHTKSFTYNSFYPQSFQMQTSSTREVLHTESFTDRGRDTQKLLKLLHTDAFKHKHICNTQRSRHTEQTFLTRTFAQNSLYTQKPFDAQKVLHRDALHKKAFPHRCFYTEQP